MGKVGGRQI